MSAQKNDNSAESEEGVKASDYVRELLKEKLSLNPEQHGNAMRLLDQEVAKAQAQTGGKPYKPENRYVDIYKDKPVKVVAKVLVPVKEHPKFNFVGKLLGPKGNSLKRLQEETMTKMAILGRGSMRDKQKEEEFRNALDPKYAHLNDDLHVEIQVLASPGEAYARIAYALAEIRKYLIPDVNDEIRQEQLREIHQYSGAPRGARGGGPPGRSGPPPSRGPAAVRGSLRPPGVAPRAAALTNLAPPMPPRPMPGKTKVLSILDRARAAMEESYGGYDDGYFDPPAAMGYSTTGFGSGYNGSGFYDSGYAEGDNCGEKYDKYGASRADVDSEGDDVEDVGGGWKSYTQAKPEKSGGKMQSSRGFRSRGRGGRGGFGSPYQRPYSQQRQPKFIN